MPPDKPRQENLSGDAPRNRVNRKRSRSRGRRNRHARRAIEGAVRTSADLQGKSRARQRTRAAGEKNRAASLDREVAAAREDFNKAKREVYATGLVPEGIPSDAPIWGYDR